MVEEYNKLDTYQWHRIRKAIIPKLDRINQKVLKLRKEASALLASLPEPEYHVLGRYGGHKPDEEIMQTYQALFRYIDEESPHNKIKPKRGRHEIHHKRQDAS